MSWREEWETTGYRRPLTDDDTNLLRVRIRAERGTVVRFAVQYEAVIEGETYPVVRYDTAHEYAHRDLLDWEGHVVQTDCIAGPESDKQALTAAIDDLRASWPAYREDFLRRKP